MKILIIEDDHIIGPNIKEYLEENNFLVTLKQDWESWLKESLKNKYDLIILDVMLPYKDWFSVARELRDNKVESSIIFLTAKEDLESIEKWFTLWGDDYLIKPFKLKELVLRIRSILKRVNKTQEINNLTWWDIILHLNLKEVERQWKKIILTPKEFQILEYLMKNKNKVVTKHELLEYIWWINNDIRSDVVRTHIQTLRNKINVWFETDPIKTIRGIWFRFDTNEK